MSVRANLSHRLLTVWNGDPWHGSSSSAILKGVTAADALARPLAATHTIWEIVEHMIAWTGETTRRLGGAEAASPALGDWPPVSGSTQDEWMAAQGRLLDARKALLAALEASHEESLFLPVVKHGDPAHGKATTRADTVNGLADHDVYHLGQIAMLKRSLTSNRA